MLYQIIMLNPESILNVDLKYTATTIHIILMKDTNYLNLVNVLAL